MRVHGILQGGYGYYTWEYDGEETIVISEMQEISITINPNENVMGSVSVDILKNDLLVASSDRSETIKQNPEDVIHIF